MILNLLIFFIKMIFGECGSGGWGGIRTHETLSRLPVFKTGAFNRSATHPKEYLNIGYFGCHRRSMTKLREMKINFVKLLVNTNWTLAILYLASFVWLCNKIMRRVWGGKEWYFVGVWPFW